MAYSRTVIELNPKYQCHANHLRKKTTAGQVTNLEEKLFYTCFEIQN